MYTENNLIIGKEDERNFGQRLYTQATHTYRKQRKMQRIKACVRYTDIVI